LRQKPLEFVEDDSNIAVRRHAGQRRKAMRTEVRGSPKGLKNKKRQRRALVEARDPGHRVGTSTLLCDPCSCRCLNRLC